MRIEIQDPIDQEELSPGDLYTNRDQAWWDTVIASKQIGVVLYVRGAYEVPKAWRGSTARRVVIHRDEDGFLPMVDKEPEVEGEEGPDETKVDSLDPESMEDGPGQVSVLNRKEGG